MLKFLIGFHGVFHGRFMHFSRSGFVVGFVWNSGVRYIFILVLIGSDNAQWTHVAFKTKLNFVVVKAPVKLCGRLSGFPKMVVPQ